METKININAARANVENAQRELELAKLAHREAFRQACAVLFTEYGLCLEGDYHGDLQIVEVSGKYQIDKLPPASDGQ